MISSPLDYFKFHAHLETTSISFLTVDKKQIRFILPNKAKGYPCPVCGGSHRANQAQKALPLILPW